MGKKKGFQRKEGALATELRGSRTDPHIIGTVSSAQYVDAVLHRWAKEPPRNSAGATAKRPIEKYSDRELLAARRLGGDNLKPELMAELIKRRLT